MHMPQNSGGDFTPPPAGTHMAICYRVVDLGTQQVEWQGKQKLQHKIMLTWELPDELMEDGRPFIVNQRYTFSSSEKSRLRQDLESWRGKKFTDADFGPGGFDVSKLIGVPCLIGVVHAHKDGKTYANISSIVKLPKGMKAPAPINESVLLDLAKFDRTVFEALSDGLRQAIMRSPEYHAAISGQPTEQIGDAPPPASEDDYGGSNDIPF